MFGLLAAFGNLGGILMPWLVGVTSDWSSLRLGLPPLDGLGSFVDAAPACCRFSRKSPLSRTPPEEIRKLMVDPDRTIIHDFPVTFC